MFNLRNVQRTASGCRPFHAPFAILSYSYAHSAYSQSPSQAAPTTQPQSQPGQALTTSKSMQKRHVQAYEKQMEVWPEPIGSVGQRIHVISDPDPDYHPYAVPVGAYPMSEPYA